MTDKPRDCERIRVLMMGLLDGELGDGEREQVERHLQTCPDCRREFDSFEHLKKETDTMRLAKLPEEYWAAYWTNVYNRIERGLGWIFFSIGAIIAVSFAVYESLKQFFDNPEVHLLLKIGISCLLFGSIILLVSVFREKWMLRRVDKYRSIER